MKRAAVQMDCGSFFLYGLRFFFLKWVVVIKKIPLP